MTAISKLHRGERGQALVEFALLAPLLMLLMLGAVDFGRALYATVAVNNAAYNGAIWASQNLRYGTQGSPSCGSGTAYCCPHSNNTSAPNLVSPSTIREAALRDFSGGFDYTNTCSSTSSSVGSACNPQVSCTTAADVAYSSTVSTQHRSVDVTVRYRFTALGPYGPWFGNTDITRTVRVRRVP